MPLLGSLADQSLELVCDQLRHALNIAAKGPGSLGVDRWANLSEMKVVLEVHRNGQERSSGAQTQRGGTRWQQGLLAQEGHRHRG